MSWLESGIEILNEPAELENGLQVVHKMLGVSYAKAQEDGKFKGTYAEFIKSTFVEDVQYKAGVISLFEYISNRMVEGTVNDITTIVEEALAEFDAELGEKELAELPHGLTLGRSALTKILTDYSKTLVTDSNNRPQTVFRPSGEWDVNSRNHIGLVFALDPHRAIKPSKRYSDGSSKAVAEFEARYQEKHDRPPNQAEIDLFLSKNYNLSGFFLNVKKMFKLLLTEAENEEFYEAIDFRLLHERFEAAGLFSENAEEEKWDHEAFLAAWTTLKETFEDTETGKIKEEEFDVYPGETIGQLLHEHFGYDAMQIVSEEEDVIPTDSATEATEFYEATEEIIVFDRDNSQSIFSGMGAKAEYEFTEEGIVFEQSDKKTAPSVSSHTFPLTSYLLEQLRNKNTKISRKDIEKKLKDKRFQQEANFLGGMMEAVFGELNKTLAKNETEDNWNTERVLTELEKALPEVHTRVFAHDSSVDHTRKLDELVNEKIIGDTPHSGVSNLRAAENRLNKVSALDEEFIKPVAEGDLTDLFLEAEQAFEEGSTTTTAAIPGQRPALRYANTKVGPYIDNLLGDTTSDKSENLGILTDLIDKYFLGGQTGNVIYPNIFIDLENFESKLDIDAAILELQKRGFKNVFLYGDLESTRFVKIGAVPGDMVKNLESKVKEFLEAEHSDVRKAKEEGWDIDDKEKLRVKLTEKAKDILDEFRTVLQFWAKTDAQTSNWLVQRSGPEQYTHLLIKSVHELYHPILKHYIGMMVATPTIINNSANKQVLKALGGGGTFHSLMEAALETDLGRYAPIPGPGPLRYSPVRIPFDKTESVRTEALNREEHKKREKIQQGIKDPAERISSIIDIRDYEILIPTQLWNWAQQEGLLKEGTKKGIIQLSDLYLILQSVDPSYILGTTYPSTSEEDNLASVIRTDINFQELGAVLRLQAVMGIAFSGVQSEHNSKIHRDTAIARLQDIFPTDMLESKELASWLHDEATMFAAKLGQEFSRRILLSDVQQNLGIFGDNAEFAEIMQKLETFKTSVGKTTYSGYLIGGITNYREITFNIEQLGWVSEHFGTERLPKGRSIEELKKLIMGYFGHSRLTFETMPNGSIKAIIFEAQSDLASRQSKAGMHGLRNMHLPGAEQKIIDQNHDLLLEISKGMIKEGKELTKSIAPKYAELAEGIIKKYKGLGFVEVNVMGITRGAYSILLKDNASGTPMTSARWESPEPGARVGPGRTAGELQKLIWAFTYEDIVGHSDNLKTYLEAQDLEILVIPNIFENTLMEHGIAEPSYDTVKAAIAKGLAYNLESITKEELLGVSRLDLYQLPAGRNIRSRTRENDFMDKKGGSYAGLIFLTPTNDTAPRYSGGEMVGPMADHKILKQALQETESDRSLNYQTTAGMTSVTSQEPGISQLQGAVDNEINANILKYLNNDMGVAAVEVNLRGDVTNAPVPPNPFGEFFLDPLLLNLLIYSIENGADSFAWPSTPEQVETIQKWIGNPGGELPAIRTLTESRNKKAKTQRIYREGIKKFFKKLNEEIKKIAVAEYKADYKEKQGKNPSKEEIKEFAKSLENPVTLENWNKDDESLGSAWHLEEAPKPETSPQRLLKEYKISQKELIDDMITEDGYFDSLDEYEDDDTLNKLSTAPTNNGIFVLGLQRNVTTQRSPVSAEESTKAFQRTIKKLLKDQRGVAPIYINLKDALTEFSYDESIGFWKYDETASLEPLKKEEIQNYLLSQISKCRW